MKKIALLIALFLVMGCTQAQGQGPKGSIDWITDLTVAKESAQSDGKPILIDFYADWCGWCKRMDSDTYADAKVATLAKKFICVKIDTEKQPDVAKEYKIRGLPTTVFLSAEAKEIETIAGYLPAEAFIKKMENALKAQ